MHETFFVEMDKQELSKKKKERSDISSEDRNVKCREIEFALPVELSKEKQIELAENFVQKSWEITMLMHLQFIRIKVR